jgi:hypothetical protein
MGLGPTNDGIRGAAGVLISGADDVSGSAGPCSLEPNDLILQQPNLSWSFTIICMFLLMVLVYFLYKVYRMASDAYSSFEPLYTDIAVMEPLVDRFCNDLSPCQAEIYVQRTKSCKASTTCFAIVWNVCDGVSSTSVATRTFSHSIQCRDDRRIAHRKLLCINLKCPAAAAASAAAAVVLMPNLTCYCSIVPVAHIWYIDFPPHTVWNFLPAYCILDFFLKSWFSGGKRGTLAQTFKFQAFHFRSSPISTMCSSVNFAEESLHVGVAWLMRYLVQVTAAAAAPAKEPERAEALSSVVLTVVQFRVRATPRGHAARRQRPFAGKKVRAKKTNERKNNWGCFSCSSVATEGTRQFHTAKLLRKNKHMKQTKPVAIWF